VGSVVSSVTSGTVKEWGQERGHQEHRGLRWQLVCWLADQQHLLLGTGPGPG
jgi:hypothetical protein